MLVPFIEIGDTNLGREAFEAEKIISYFRHVYMMIVRHPIEYSWIRELFREYLGTGDGK